MELTLESALSPGGAVGHLSYLLLVLSMCMRDMTWLRILVVASALVGITYDWVWLRDPVGVFWEGLLLFVNLVQLLLLWRSNRKARFSPDETAFAERRLRGLTPAETRRLLDLGRWETLPKDRVMTRQGQRPASLFYIHSGSADVIVDGVRVAVCGPGRYVGEMSLFGDGKASATTRTSEVTRVWCIARSEIGGLRANEPTMMAVLEAGIARDMRGKLIDRNIGDSRRKTAAEG